MSGRYYDYKVVGSNGSGNGYDITGIGTLNTAVGFTPYGEVQMQNRASNVLERTVTLNNEVIVRRRWVRPATPTCSVSHITTRGATIQSRLISSKDETYADAQHNVMWTGSNGDDVKTWQPNRHRYTRLTHNSNQTFQVQTQGQPGHGGYSDVAQCGQFTTRLLAVKVEAVAANTRTVQVQATLTNGIAAEWTHDNWTLQTGDYAGQYLRSDGATLRIQGQSETGTNWRGTLNAKTVTPTSDTTGSIIRSVAAVTYQLDPNTTRADTTAKCTALAAEYGSHCIGIENPKAGPAGSVANQTGIATAYVRFDRLAHNQTYTGNVINTDGFNTVGAANTPTSVVWSASTQRLNTQVESMTLGCNNLAVTRSIYTTGHTWASDGTGNLAGNLWTSQIGIGTQVKRFNPVTPITLNDTSRTAATYRAYCSETLTQNTTHTGTSLGADGVNTVQETDTRQTPPITASVTVRKGDLANSYTTRSVTATGTPGNTSNNTVANASTGYDLSSYIAVEYLWGTGPRPNQSSTPGAAWDRTVYGAQRGKTSGLNKSGTESLVLDPFHDGTGVKVAGRFTDGYNYSTISGTNQTNYDASRGNTVTLDTIQGEARIQRDDNQPTRKVHLWANKASGQTWVNLTKMTLSGSGSGTTTWNAGSGLTINPMNTGMAAASKVNNDTRTQNASQTNTAIFNDCKAGEALSDCNARTFTASVNTQSIQGTVSCSRNSNRPTRQIDSQAVPSPVGVKVVNHTIGAGSDRPHNFGPTTVTGSWPGQQPTVNNTLDGLIHNTTYTCTAGMSDGYNTVVTRNASVTTQQIAGTVTCQPMQTASRHVRGTSTPSVNFVHVSSLRVNNNAATSGGKMATVTNDNNDLPDGSSISCVAIDSPRVS